MAKQAPLYVYDRTRNIIVGQFFKRESALEVQALLNAHSAKDDARITDFDFVIESMLRDGATKLDEAGLQAIAAEKYLPMDPYLKSSATRFSMVPGAVYNCGAPEQLVAVKVESRGHKFCTWYMVGALSGKGYRFRHRNCEAAPAFIRMASVQEWARALGRKQWSDERKQERIDTNTSHININDIRVGDTVTVRYSNGDRNEVVEAINHKNGRVAIKRRGMAAIIREKRRFIDAKHIVAVVEKCADPYRRNPINDPMWMR